MQSLSWILAVNGGLFEPGNVDDLYEKIMKFIRNPNLLKELPVNRFRYPTPMQQHALDIEALYEECMRDKKH